MKQEGKISKIEISYKTIIFIGVFILLLWFLYRIKKIILLLFLSMILMGAINPTITRLEKFKIPRWLSILLIYLLIIFILTISVIGIMPPLIEQTKELINLLPSFLNQFHPLGFTPEFFSNQSGSLGNLSGEIVKILVAVVSNVFSIFAILLVTFYLLIEHKNLDRYLFLLFGEKTAVRAKRLIGAMESKLGGWIRGEFFLMSIIGILSYIGFRILGLEFALPLAIISGLLEVVPNFGPAIAAIPAIIIGLTVSPLTAAAVAAWCFLIQQLENNLIVPKVMQKASGANPLITILSLAVGFEMAGVLGAVLAVPAYLAIETLLAEFLSSRKKVSAGE